MHSGAIHIESILIHCIDIPEMKVNETFISLQGEGPYMGIPMFFVRLTGCNLRCAWCDTQYAFYEGEEVSLEKVMDMVEKSGMEWVCITGGEPLLQEEVYTLADSLLRRDYRIILETNGSILIDKLPTEENLMVSLDIKTPSSGMEKFMKFENLKYLGPKDYVKFVIMDEKDFEYAKGIIERYEIHSEIIFQPVWGTELRWLAERVLQEGLRVRVLPQLHKIIWGEKRGV